MDNYQNKAWKEARRHFGIEDNPNLVLHHKDETLKHTDYERYLEWRPEDLVVLTRGEHASIHHKNRPLTEDHKIHLSDCKLGDKNPMYGKEPWNKGKKGVQTAWNKGLKGEGQSCYKTRWYNNGEINVRRKECPEGFKPGMITTR